MNNNYPFILKKFDELNNNKVEKEVIEILKEKIRKKELRKDNLLVKTDKYDIKICIYENTFNILLGIRKTKEIYIIKNINIDSKFKKYNIKRLINKFIT